MRNPLSSAAAVLSGLLLLALTPFAMAIEWPQEVTAEEGRIIVYEPQPERLSGNRLTGRAAMSLELTDRPDPIFGAFWYEATLDTDRDTGTALIRDVRVTDVRWPDSRDADEQRFTAVVESAVPENGFPISMERLRAGLQNAEIEQASLSNLNNEPPTIIFRDEIAVLMLYDGAPKYSPVENSDYERVLNAPFAVVRRAGSTNHYLYSGTFWYEAADAMGPWAWTDDPPADLVAAMPPPEVDDKRPDRPPAVVTADEPTELVATDGPPDWQSLAGGKLLYVENTETPWLRDLATSNMYLLLSGRWFRAKSQDGPWTFVPGDELPASFAEIPPASDLGGLRTSVASTPEARDAVMDQYIPQTAAIKRSEAKLDVAYDGSAQFEEIPGTSLSYAINTGAQVLKVGNRYYAVDNGVWFTSLSPDGPWAIADDIPSDEIAKIPPTSPAYNTTYVHVYESTPEVVYVGYMPGYMWSFPYYGVPVYGTGWRYPPYYGRWYYPRPPTWGFNVGYNPWTGWNYGLSWSNGFFTFNMSWGGGWGGSYYRPWGCCNGWYGGGYRGPVIINTGDINIGNNVNVGNRVGIADRVDRDGLRDKAGARKNIYQRPENLSRNADRATALGNLKQARPLPERANDVYADRSGAVARDAAGVWETRGDDQWVRDGVPAAGDQVRDRVAVAERPESLPSGRPEAGIASRPDSRPATVPGNPPASRPQARPSGTIDRADLDRARDARMQGNARERDRPSNMRSPPQRPTRTPVRR